GDHAAHHHHQARAIRLRRRDRDRGRDAGGLVRPSYRDQLSPMAQPTLQRYELTWVDACAEPDRVRYALTALALGFVGIFRFMPLAVVFNEALRKGWEAYVAAIAEPDARSAVRLTLAAAAIAVPLNTVFGVAAAWAIAKFDFRGKNVLVTLIDLPFSVSPVVSGLVYVLIFGAQGWLGPWLQPNALRLIFPVPC